jgi:transcriptional regulator with XRE-family HTH domain
METSRIGRSLRAARTRLGWSREALAYHSGISWSAIAQIESGRRTDVRLNTLLALADALGVSVDHLIGTSAAVESRLLEHRVHFYGSDEELVAGAVPVLAEGMDRSESLLAVMPQARLDLLRDALGDASPVEFVDSAGWYRSPGAALDRYRDYLIRRFDDSVTWTRVVAEIPLVDASPAEVATWVRYESIVNLAFARSPATIVCFYGTQTLPGKVVREASRAHPTLAEGTVSTVNPSYRDAEELLLGPAAARRD